MPELTQADLEGIRERHTRCKAKGYRTSFAAMGEFDLPRLLDEVERLKQDLGNATLMLRRVNRKLPECDLKRLAAGLLERLPLPSPLREESTDER